MCNRACAVCAACGTSSGGACVCARRRGMYDTMFGGICIEIVAYPYVHTCASCTHTLDQILYTN